MRLSTLAVIAFAAHTLFAPLSMAAIMEMPATNEPMAHSHCNGCPDEEMDHHEAETSDDCSDHCLSSAKRIASSASSYSNREVVATVPSPLIFVRATEPIMFALSANKFPPPDTHLATVVLQL